LIGRQNGAGSMFQCLTDGQDGGGKDLIYGIVTYAGSCSDIVLVECVF
jgi:hypothetical protein